MCGGRGGSGKGDSEGGPEFDSDHPGLQLKSAAKSRDRLSHGYRNIDLSVLWNTATNSIPLTVEAAKEVLSRRLKSGSKGG
jgi:uncharacterized protein with HEPN domain